MGTISMSLLVASRVPVVVVVVVVVAVVVVAVAVVVGVVVVVVLLLLLLLLLLRAWRGLRLSWLTWRCFSLIADSRSDRDCDLALCLVVCCFGRAGSSSSSLALRCAC
jgi:hypothetical protein